MDTRTGSILARALVGASLSFLAACGDTSSAPPLHVEVVDPESCEILDPSLCVLPFPSNRFTVADASTDTGLRVAFAETTLPANAQGVHIDPTQWNRNDGFSPGAQMTTLVPRLDAKASKLPPITDLARSLDDDASVVVIDADTGERVLAWAELDAKATDDARRALLIHPARNLREGHRHVVALRRLVDRSGADIEPNDVFRAYRDGLRTDSEAVEARRPAMERIFVDLEAAGVPRADLFLAWDFTVASGRSLSERLLHLRDDAFGELGAAAPRFEVRGVSQLNALVRVVNGTFEVPRYLTGDGGAGTGFDYAPGPDGLPQRNGTQVANFICTVPSTAGASNPARAFLYGHGLLGSAGEVLGNGAAAALANVVSCATDWIGMSAGDIGNAANILQDVSSFYTLADRLQQGHLNFLFLGRLMIHPDGFGSNPAFQHDGTSPFRGDLYFLGASQGGILGGATTAVAQDFTRSIFAVGASNYSLLIPRSVDFDEFTPILTAAYPDEVVRSFILAIAQMLWDRGEANGYLQHMVADEYPGTPHHEILFFEAFGDHQVANVGTEVAGRSMDLSVKTPALRPGRSTSVEPMYGLRPETAPFAGSGVVIWDFDSPAPPDENLPPRAGRDPHGAGGREPRVLELVSEFLRPDGVVADVCGGGPCVTPAN
ncbi:hypothetical protein KGQ64_11275 [bacterium]|nr:hypothetical protein [bacterium]